MLARREMRAGLSPRSEEAVGRRKDLFLYVLNVAPHFMAPALVYGLLMIPFVCGKWRRTLVTVLVGFVGILFAALCRGSLADIVFPSTYAFLNDYDYVDGVDLSSANVSRGTTIVAYDWRSFKGQGRRIIGFADGHVESLWDRDAKPLFNANGLAFPDGSPHDTGNRP